MSASEQGSRWPYLVAALFLTLDQITKHLVVAKLSPVDVIEVIPHLFNLRHVHNEGAAFSLFSGYPELLGLFSIVVFGLIVVFRQHLFPNSPANNWAFGLLLGGILGNLIDRMRYGYVIDFLDFYAGTPKWTWPTFNVADSCICVAVGLYMLMQWREGRETEKEPARDLEG